MSEINEHIKNLILIGKRDEAKKELMEQYGLSEEKAVEFVNRFEKANHKKLAPGLAKKVSKGCGCFTVLFLVAFVWGLYTGITSVLDSEDKVNSMVIDLILEERVDESTAKSEIWYTPIVEFYYGDRDYVDTLYNETSRTKKYNKGDIIELNVDPNWPQYASSYDIGDAIADSSVYLILAIFSFIGYRFLKNFELKIPITDEMIAEAKRRAKDKDDLGETIAEIKREREGSSSSSEDETSETDGGDSSKKFVTKPKSSKKSEGGPWVAIVVGLVFAAVGIFLIVVQYQGDQRAAVLSEGVKVSGTVISETSSRSDNSTTYYYVIEYQYENQFYSYETYFSFDDYNYGDQVELMVNPDNPSDVAINRSDDLSKGGSYIWGIVCFLLGAFATQVGIKETIKEIRKKREIRKI